MTAIDFNRTFGQLIVYWIIAKQMIEMMKQWETDLLFDRKNRIPLNTQKCHK